jgi:hypothetical protein
MKCCEYGSDYDAVAKLNALLQTFILFEKLKLNDPIEQNNKYYDEFKLVFYLNNPPSLTSVNKFPSYLLHLAPLNKHQRPVLIKLFYGRNLRMFVLS